VAFLTNFAACGELGAARAIIENASRLLQGSDGMARDRGLEELVLEQLRDVPDLSEKAMFGGRAWLMHGHLLCGARDTGVLLRLGKGHDGWALEFDGIDQMIMRGRSMPGWVRVAPETFGDETLARKLIGAALDFVLTLPPK
jgi:hypothetical protein